MADGCIADSVRFPRAFGRFWLQEKVGQGGMAEVFRATLDPSPTPHASEFAIKRMHARLESDPMYRDLFTTEADVTKLLIHDNIVRVCEVGVIDEHPFIAMEYISGLNINQLIAELYRRRQRMPTQIAVAIAMAVLRALDYVHRAIAPGGAPMELIHRDVTPSNIYLTYDGRVKLGDFGVARVSFLEGEDEAQTLKGKAAYMPPEVLAGSSFDARLDLWSMSVTLFEMLTLRRLYGARDNAKLKAGHAVRIPPIRNAELGGDRALCALLRRALHRRPSQRPQSARELYYDLRGYLHRRELELRGDEVGCFLHDMFRTTRGENPRYGYAAASVFEATGNALSDESAPTERLEFEPGGRRSRGVAAVCVMIILVVATILGVIKAV